MISVKRGITTKNAGKGFGFIKVIKTTLDKKTKNMIKIIIATGYGRSGVCLNRNTFRLFFGFKRKDFFSFPLSQFNFQLFSALGGWGCGSGLLC